MTVNPRHSFKLQLVLCVLLISLGAFVLLTVISGVYVHREVSEEVTNVANAKLDVAVTTLRARLTETIVSAENFESLSSSPTMTHDPDSIYSLGKLFLKANPRIYGFTMAYVPDAGLPYSRRAAPFITRENDGTFSCTDINNTYDYRTHDWYKVPHFQHKDRWSPAFRSTTGHLITCFSTPLKNDEGKEFAVLVLDINVEEIADTLQNLRPYPRSQLSIIDGKGRYVSHSDKSLILTADIDSLCRVGDVEVNQDVVNNIKNGRRGSGKFKKDGEEYYVFYAPVEMNGWAVTLEVPERELSKDFDSMYRTIFIAMFFVVMLLIIVSYTIFDQLTRPLETFAAVARKISHGDFHAKLPVIRNRNELYDLNQALSSMEDSLDSYMNRLKESTSKSAVMQNELDIARGIQMAMVPQKFPPFPERPDIDIYASLTPAKAVGGDLYDYLLYGDDLYFCIGDVSGKGVPASLFMAIVRSMFHTVATTEQKPAAIARRLNEVISENNEQNMFVTMIIGKCNISDGTVILCNCGHNVPLSNGRIDLATGFINPSDKMDYYREAPTNIPIGVIPGYDYKEVKLHVTPGTNMFLYTDGVTEAEDKQQNLFGDVRLRKALNSCGRDASAESLVKTVVGKVGEFAQLTEQSDDITMLCIRLNGTPIETDQSIRRLNIMNKLDELTRLHPFLESMFEAFNVPTELFFKVNLALDEAMANAVNYAYPKNQQGMVTLTARRVADQLIFQRFDQGEPFDPTTMGDRVDITSPASERKIGGLGIYIIKRVMDSVTYERREDKNVLTMVKELRA